MNRLRVAIGMFLVLTGMALGIYLTLYYFAQGVLLIRSGQLQRGLIVLLLWSELLGIAATLALVIPGVLVLRNLDRPDPPIQAMKSGSASG